MNTTYHITDIRNVAHNGWSWGVSPAQQCWRDRRALSTRNE